MSETAYLKWPVFRRSIVAAFGRSLTVTSISIGQFSDGTSILAISALDRVRDAVEDHVRPRVEQDEMAS